MEQHLVMYRNLDLLSILNNKSVDSVVLDGAQTVLTKLTSTPIDTLMLMLFESSGLDIEEIDDPFSDLDGMSRFELSFNTYTNYEPCPFYWESETLNLFNETLIAEIDGCLRDFWSSVIDDDILTRVTYLLNDLIYVVIGMVSNSVSREFTGGVHVKTRVGYIRGEAIVFSIPEIIE